MPYHSIVRDSATPAFTLDPMQDVLWRVYVENHRRANKRADIEPYMRSEAELIEQSLLD